MLQACQGRQLGRLSASCGDSPHLRCTFRRSGKNFFLQYSHCTFSGGAFLRNSFSTMLYVVSTMSACFNASMSVARLLPW